MLPKEKEERRRWRRKFFMTKWAVLSLLRYSSTPSLPAASDAKRAVR